MKLSQLAVKFLPLIKRWCGYYCRQMKLIEYDELFQEGVMALYQLLCGHENEDEIVIRKFLIRNMRGIIRDIADRMHRNLYIDDSLDIAIESEDGELNPVLLIPDEENRSFASEETEVFAKLKRILTAEEYRLAELKYAGVSNRAIAEQLSISHTAVAAKLEKLGEKITKMLQRKKHKSLID